MFPMGHFKKCSPGRCRRGFQYKRRARPEPWDRAQGWREAGGRAEAMAGSISEEERPEGDWRGVVRAGSGNPVSF